MRQKLGQHFLTDSDLLARIASYVDVQEGETIIEIGPGHGELTAYLVREAARVHQSTLHLLEKDETLAAALPTTFASAFAQGTIAITQGDALVMLPKIAERLAREQRPYKLVGNIPYYITGFLFRTIGELAHKPRMSVLLIQKEVAERVTAVPPRMNLLAASVQYWADAELLDFVPKQSFSPPPEVDSAVIRLVTKRNMPVTPPDAYYASVKALFRQPRKNVLNNLKSHPRFAALTPEEQRLLFDAWGHKPTERAQTMHIASILLLANLLYNR